jgi:NADH-quinone oxidoreductase subunit A
MSQLEQYSILVLLTALAVMFIMGLLLLERMLMRKFNAKSQEEVAGSSPAWRRYHIHFYIFALLFLAFDMEMAYMYPWAIVYRELGLVALLDMGVFLLILFLGLLYAWSQKGLRRQ